MNGLNSIIIAVIFAAGCATSIPVIVKLTCPIPLELPNISGEELQVLEPDAYRRFRDRDIMLVERIKTLRETMKFD